MTDRVDDRQMESHLVRAWRRHLCPLAGPTISRLGEAQAAFVVNALSSLDTTQVLYTRLMRQCLATSSVRPQSTAPSIGSAVFVSPHLAFSKLMAPSFCRGLRASKRHLVGAIPNREPWLWRHACAWSIAQLMSMRLFTVEMEYGAPIDSIQQHYDSIRIPATGSQRTRLLLSPIRMTLATHKRVAISMFPEAGSTGKRVGNGLPHSIEPFRTGFAVVAAEFALPVVPIAHVVDRRGMSHFDSLPPVAVSLNSDYREAARSVRDALARRVNELLALNLEVAGREDRGDPGTAPGVPASYGDPADLITDDCIRP